MLFLWLHNSLLNIWGGPCWRHIAMPALTVSIQANQPNSFDHWVSLSVAYKQHADQNQLEKQRGIKIEIQHAWFWGCSATELFEFFKKTYFKKMCFFWSGKCLYSPPLIFLDICWLRFVFWVICPTLSCLCRWQWGSKICSGAVAVDSAAHTKVEQKKWVRQFWGRAFRSENGKIKELKSDECGNY